MRPLDLPLPGLYGNPFKTKQGNRPSCRDQEWRRGPEEAVPGTSVFSSSQTGVSMQTLSLFPPWTLTSTRCPRHVNCPPPPSSRAALSFSSLVLGWMQHSDLQKDRAAASNQGSWPTVTMSYSGTTWPGTDVLFPGIDSESFPRACFRPGIVQSIC